MPSKRKRSGPGVSHRDNPSGSSRPRFEERGKRRSQLYRVSSKSIAGPGILVSCVQGRERKAALQFVDLLNETADRIYPGVTPLPQREPLAAKTTEDDEDDMDALRNGPSSVQQEAAPAQPPPLAKTDGDDIEAQITAELQDIKASERSGPRSGLGTVERFRKVETDTECLVFISVSPPFDPLTLVVAILDDVAKTGEPGTRFVQRLSPVSNTCHADFNSLLEHARAVLPRFFPLEGPGRTFKIDPRIRSHSTLHRSDVIAAIAQAIPTSPQNPKLHSANLDKPDLWIIVEILKNVAAISVLAHYDQYKKYNLQTVADAANQHKADQHHTAHPTAAHGRIATSLAKPTPVPPANLEAPGREPESEQAEQQAPPETSNDGHDSMAGFKLF